LTDATCAVYMERNSVAPENDVAVGKELGVFVGDAKEFINGV